MLEPKLWFYPRPPKRKLPSFDPNFFFAPSAAQFEDLRRFDVILTDVWVVGGGVSALGKRNQSPCLRCVCTWHIQHLHVEAELVGPIGSTLITASNGTRPAARFSLEPHHERAVGHNPLNSIEAACLCLTKQDHESSNNLPVGGLKILVKIAFFSSLSSLCRGGGLISW